MSLDVPDTMLMAGMAYASPSFIAGYLSSHPFCGARWEVAWIPDDIPAPANFAFVARDQATEECVVAIRGTYPDPLSSAYWEDGRQDSPFGDMYPWPSDPTGEARIAAGTRAGFDGLLALSGGGVTLGTFLSGLSAPGGLTVTGHSMGGTLAPVLALWMSEQTGIAPTVLAFAGMTPGNAAFAALFGPDTVLDGKVTRINNTLDTVPYGWDRVLETRSFYEPEPKGGLLVEGLLLATATRLIGYGFAPVGLEVKLPGVLRSHGSACELVSYVLENLHQHMPDTYLSLLGAPPLPFTIGFGPFVDERQGPGGDPGAVRFPKAPPPPR